MHWWGWAGLEGRFLCLAATKEQMWSPVGLQVKEKGSVCPLLSQFIGQPKLSPEKKNHKRGCDLWLRPLLNNLPIAFSQLYCSCELTVRGEFVNSLSPLFKLVQGGEEEGVTLQWDKTDWFILAGRRSRLKPDSNRGCLRVFLCVCVILPCRWGCAAPVCN